MVKYIVLCFIVIAGYVFYSSLPVYQGPGITAEEQPELSRLSWQQPVNFRSATLVPKKVIEGEVRIVKKKRYFFDSMSKYAPVDAVVGWNELSDERNLDFIHFSLGDRLYDVEVARPPVPLEQIYEQTDLWHLVPSNSSIDEKVKGLRDGHIIRIKGLLVDIQLESDYGFNTKASESKSNHNDGFIIWIEELYITQ